MPEQKNANKAARIACEKFARAIRQYADSHAANKADLSMFARALGYGSLCNTMIASDLVLRRKSAKFLGASLERLRSENPNLSFQFWTLVHERGNTSDRDPVIDLKFIRTMTDKTMRGQGLDSISVIESQGLGNHPRLGEGRTIMTHTHAVSWTRKILDLPKIEAELNANGLWHNDLGARPVRVTQVSDKPGELAYLAYYLFKPPYDVKMLEDRQRGPRLKSTEKGYKPEFAARLLEMLTQIELGELVRSSGEGKLVRREWHRRLSHWHRSREKWANGNLPSFYFDEFWDRYRNKKKKKEYQPFAILR